jgi:predicted PurR-regulated permease PerM
VEAGTVRSDAGPTTRTIVRILTIIVVGALLLWLVYVLRKPIGWIFIAGFIAIAVSGPVNVLQRRMRRGLAIAIVYIGLIAVPIGMLALLVPPIVTQVNNLIQKAPEYASDVTDYVNKNQKLKDLDDKYDLTTKLREQAGKLAGKVGDVAGLLGDIGLGLVNSIFAAVTILTLSIFMVGGGPRWRRRFIEGQPERRAHALNRMFDRVADSTGNYVRGALLQALIAAVVAFIVMTILGIPYPAALAVVVFLADLIPLVGATLGAILVGVITVFGDFPTDTIIWAVFSIIYQQVENNVIQPRIQSRATQVEPFIVVVSVLFGGTLFGIPGALLSVPVAAAIQIAVRDFLAFRRGEFDDPEVPLPPTPPPGEEPPDLPPEAAPA